MADSDVLAVAFEQHRDRLRAVAYRLLGSMTDADDAVQDTWLRLTGADTSEVENLGAWLTTVVARVSLNMLRSRRYRREDPVGDSWTGAAEHAARTGAVAGPGAAGTGGRGSSPAGHAAGYAALRALIAPPTSSASVRWQTRSSRRQGAVTSRRWSRCSTPMLC